MPAAVSSIASWSFGVAPFAPINEVPTIALVVAERLCFDALTFCEVEHPATLRAQATTNASLIRCIAEFSNCFVGGGGEFRRFQITASLLGRREVYERVERPVDGEGQQSATQRSQTDLEGVSDAHRRSPA
jgi:hypothetical protein